MPTAPEHIRVTLGYLDKLALSLQPEFVGMDNKG